MHALPTMVAMRAGKHVYCQKPLTHTVWEARQLRLQAAKSKVRTQMGNQIHSAKEYRTGVKLIQTGRIGKILAVHTWHPNTGNRYTNLSDGNVPASGPVPAGVEWDLWLGGAPARDFVPDIYHPFKWRDWVDFGCGTMGDFGCHLLDPVFTALKLGNPLGVKADSVGANEQTWCREQTIEWTFPGTEYTKGETLKVTWYDGGRLPDLALAQMPAGEKFVAAGSIFIGELGVMMLPHVGMPMLFPEEKFGKNLNPRRTRPPRARQGQADRQGRRGSHGLRRRLQPLSCVGRRDRRRTRDHGQFRLRRPSDGSRPTRQRRLALLRREARLGCGRHEIPGQTRSRSLAHEALSQGMGTHRR
jgi:hypothetical protein